MFGQQSTKKVKPEKRRLGRYIFRSRVKKSPKDVTDSKRFAAMDAQMNALRLDINKYGDDIESAIVNHRTSPSGPRESPFAWDPPPRNPDGTPYDEKALTDRLGKTLNAQDIGTLKETNKAFRALLADLEAIQEWWVMNRSEWGLRRQDFQYFQASIESLVSQVGGQDNLEKAEHADARRQYYLQVEVASSRLEWFAENEEMMKNVVKQFKEIKAKVEEIVTKFRNSTAEPWVFLPNFSFEEEYTLFDFKEDKVPWWRGGRGFFEVCANLRGYITASMDELRDLDADRQAQKELLKRALEDIRLQTHKQGSPEQFQLAVNAQYTDLQTLDGRTDPQSLATADLIRREIVDLESKKGNLDRIAAENAERTRALQDNLARVRWEIVVLDQERSRGRALRSLARALEARLFDQQVATPLRAVHLRETERMTYIQHWYMIMRTHYLNNKNILSLLTILQDDDLQNSDIFAIVNLLGDHRNKYTENLFTMVNTITQHLSVPRGGTDRIWRSEDIREKVWYNFEYEYEDRDNLVDTAAELLRERKAELAQRPAAIEKMREIALGDEALAFNKAAPAWQAAIGEINTMAEAEYAVSGQMDVIGGWVSPARKALRAFFVSPDVAPYFRYTYRMSRDTFHELVNSHLRRVVWPKLLDAFLMVCHDSNELFTLHYDGKISVAKEGWELVDEMPVAGPPRAVRPVKPSGQDDLETWLMKTKADFIDDDTTKRDCLASELFPRLQRHFPEGSEERFMDAMHFFSQVGRFYNIPTTQVKGGEIQLRRIDNGWKIDPATPHFTLEFASDSTFRSWYFYWNSAAIRRQVSTHRFDYLPPDEKQLYALFEPRLRAEFAGNLLGFGRIVPTPHRFHMFLRWCTQNDPDFLTLNRDGTVEGRGVTFP